MISRKKFHTEKMLSLPKSTKVIYTFQNYYILQVNLIFSTQNISTPVTFTERLNYVMRIYFVLNEKSTKKLIDC